MVHIISGKGPPIKDVCTKSRKIDPLPFVRKMSALTQPPLSVQTHHKFQKIRSFLRQKVWTSASEDTPPFPLVRKMSAMDELLPPDCGRLLWTAPKDILL